MGGRYEPYSPMHEPKDVSFERMQEILAKHGQLPLPKPPEIKPTVLLEWERPTSAAQMGLYTTCKRYTCAKVVVAGKPMYEVYRLAPQSEWYACIGAGLQSFEQAKAVAQRDFDKGLKP